MFPSAPVRGYNGKLMIITVNFRVVNISVLYFSPISCQKQDS